MSRDPQGVRLSWALTTVLGGGGLLAVLLLPKCETPPIASQEWGPPGFAMDTFAEVGAPPLPANAISFPLPDAVENAGISAGEAYENVQVLGDLNRAWFDRLMEAITAWVAPHEGCTFCHAAGPEGRPDYDAAPPPTFEVARTMLRMTRELNADPAPHLQPQGVTCFSCHRGQNIPPCTWYKAGDWPPPSERWFQEPPPWIRTATAIRDFLPREAFERFILEDHRVAGIQTREMQVPAPDEPDPEAAPSSPRPRTSTSS